MAGGNQQRIDTMLLGQGIERLTKLIDGRHTPVCRIVCAQHGGFEETAFPLDSPPERIINSFRNKGWALGRKPKCPECSKPQRKETQVQTREPTVVETVNVSRLLESHFSDGRYLNGYSDQKVADELKLPRIIVEKVRALGYGPIKADPEIEALKSEIAGLESMLGDLKARVGKVEKRING